NITHVDGSGTPATGVTKLLFKMNMSGSLTVKPSGRLKMFVSGRRERPDIARHAFSHSNKRWSWAAISAKASMAQRCTSSKILKSAKAQTKRLKGGLSR